MTTTTILNENAATLARNAGMARVSTPAPWLKIYWKTLERFARTGVPFLSEDVTQAAGGVPSNVDPRAVGPIFRRARQVGLLRATGRIPQGKSVTRHRGFCREWVGTGVLVGKVVFR